MHPESGLVVGAPSEPQPLAEKARRGVHANSIEAFHSQEAKLSHRAAAVLAWITAHGPHTDREVMEGMGFREPNAVRPRITELLAACKLMEVGDVKCPVTGITVRRVDIRRPRQAALFQEARA